MGFKSLGQPENSSDILQQSFKLVFVLFLTAFTKTLFAASCCGGGASLPQLITGDYRAQLALVGANSAVTHYANEDSLISERDVTNQEVSESLTLSATYLLSPYWQMGLRLPYKVNTHKTLAANENSSGIGDFHLQTAYEFLPEYSFSLWRPKGYVFIDETLPSSSSSYDAEKPLHTDSFGSGFYTTSVGVSFVKAIFNYDFLFMTEYHKAFNREFNKPGERLSVEPGDGHTMLFGAGYSPKGGDLRLGGSLLYSKQNASKVTSSLSPLTSSGSQPRHYWETGLSVSYLFKNYSLTASYLDQSFLANASNSLLTKSLSISVVSFLEL